MPVAVEAMPPKPNTAATSAITRNISAQYNIVDSLRDSKVNVGIIEGFRMAVSNPRRRAALPPST
jgi:hypothetical protein